MGKKTAIELSFDSLGDMVTAIAPKPVTWSENHDLASENTTEPEWYGSADYDSAVVLAEHGWPQGRDYMQDTMADIQSVSEPSPVPAQALDVAGAYPVAPLAAAGEMFCMVSLGDSLERSRPVIDVDINLSRPSSCEPSEINNWGGVILSEIDKLESAGYSVNLTVHKYSGDYDDKFTCDVAVNVKRASEPLEIDRLAFVLTSPAMQRRLMFRALEHAADLGDGFKTDNQRKTFCNKYAGSYGVRIMKAPKKLDDTWSVWIPPMANNGMYDTPEKALETMSGIFAAALPQIYKREG